MSIFVEATEVTFDEDRMWVALDDGRSVGVPLAWYPRLLKGSLEDRAKVWITPSGLHWDELDEDISIASILAGRGDMTRSPLKAA
jgi:hypothetical protein